MRRIAVVTLGSISRQPLASLVEGLRELGYEEGRNIRNPAAMAEGGIPPASGDGRRCGRARRGGDRHVRRHRYRSGDQSDAGRSDRDGGRCRSDRAGFINNLARPEANVTGLATSTQVLIAKRFELLRETVPGIRRLAALWNSESVGQAASLRMLEAAAARMSIAVHGIDLRGREGLDGAAEALTKVKADALTALPATTMRALGPEVVKLAAAHKLPAIYSDADLVRVGGLMAYSPDAKAQLRRASHYVDRILKGAKPADLAVEQPTKFELVINLKTAKALGIAIPQSVLLRADGVIQ
jgi:ABC transporter substrate binding protein